AVPGGRSLDLLARHPLRDLGERREHLAGVAFDLPDADLHADLVAFHPGPGKGVLRVPAAARVRAGGRLPRAGPVPVLRFLGSLPGADVLPDRILGARPPHLRRGEVLPLHDGRLGADARRDYLHLQPGADVQLSGDSRNALVGPAELLAQRADAAVPG